MHRNVEGEVAVLHRCLSSDFLVAGYFCARHSFGTFNDVIDPNFNRHLLREN